MNGVNGNGRFTPQNLAESYAEARKEYRDENGYRHTKPTRFRPRVQDVLSSGSAGDYHLRTRSEFVYSAELARELDRSDPIVGAALNRIVDMLVPSCYGLSSQTGIAEIDDYIEQEWQRDASDTAMDASGRHSYAIEAQLAVRSVIRDGDVFKLPHNAGRVWLEYHRCLSPQHLVNSDSCVHGVEIGSQNEHLAYWFTERDAVKTSQPQKVRRVAAYSDAGPQQVVQLFMPKRFSENRGVTIIAPIADLAGMVDDINFAKLVQQQAVSAFTLVHKYPQQFAPPDPLGSKGDPSISIPSGEWRPLRGVVAGMEYFGQAGEEVEALSANVPNPEYFRQIMLILSIIAVNCGMPVQLLMLDPSSSTYTGWRGAMDQARIGIRAKQNWIAAAHFATDYRWWLQYRIATDPTLLAILTRHGFEIDNPWGQRNSWVFQHAFHPPAFRYIEPVTDITARRLDLASGFTSPRRSHAEFNSDFYAVTDEKIEDGTYAIERAMQAAVSLNQVYGPMGQLCSWRDLHEPITSGNVSISIQPDAGHSPGQPSDPNGNGGNNNANATQGGEAYAAV